MNDRHDAAPHGPLAGLRVLDFSIMVAGPYCTRYLADMGAEVIKVEPPEQDYLRTREPLRDGRSAYFAQLNCGKRSIRLDLKDPAAIEVAKALAAKSDVVVENFRPGVMKRLGIGYDVLSQGNPGLVYCAVSGFGQDGPGADRPAYAQVVQASSGYDLAFMQYQDSQERPANSNIFVADVLASVYALSGILAALHQRGRTGRGQLVDVALMDGMLNLLPYETQEAQFPAKERRQVYVPVKAADGFLILCPTTAKNFESLCEVVGHPEWKTDPRFATGPARVRNWQEMMRLVEQWTVARPAKECESTFMGTGIPAATYRTVREALQDPQFAHRGSLARVVDASGEFFVPNLPFRLSGASVQAGARVADSGQDTAAVLMDVLGMAPEQAKAFVDRAA
jgi:CoA:oxalate CoA-transferase